MELKIIYEDDTLLVVDKPAGVSIEDLPKLTSLGEEYRWGIVHRLDKDTTGVLLVAKTKEAFEFLQKQFQDRNVEKRYVCLVVGKLKDKEGSIQTFLGRAGNDRRKQRASLVSTPDAEDKKSALTNYKVLEEFNEYTLLEIRPKTGRKHQIRAHMAHLSHPVAGDKLYGFKSQPTPKGLLRQFLHAEYLKTQLPNGMVKEFHSKLPEDLQNIINNLKNHDNN